MSPRIDAAVLVAVAVLVAAVAPGIAGAAGESTEQLLVDVTQDGADVTVTVTQNGTAVDNASVSVATLTNSTYAGEGTYTTDVNGTVGLSAPSENVTVEVTATTENASGSTAIDLLAVESDPEFDSFGGRVSWFVHTLLGDDFDGGLGQFVSEFVTSNNPGADNKPDHAGPNADHAKNGTANGNGHGNAGDHPAKGNDKGNNGNGNEKKA